MKNGLSLRILLLITVCGIILNCRRNPSQSEKLSIAVILDRKVETTQINNINARIKRYAFSTGRSTAIGKTILQNVERDSISFSIEYYSEDIIEDAHYWLDIQLFMSVNQRDFRKTLVKTIELQKRPEETTLAVERPISPTAHGFFGEKQSYARELFETNEACEAIQHGALPGCHQRIEFDSTGGATVVVTDIINIGNYHIDADTLSIELRPNQEISGTLQFILSSDRQLMFDMWNGIWANIPSQ